MATSILQQSRVANNHKEQLMVSQIFQLKEIQRTLNANISINIENYFSYHINP
jgi:hypothetical protein